jgi:undecaprenyl diphosphate synthase
MNKNKTNIPRHVAIIMDGNGRWARSRNLPAVMGHREGIKTVKRVISSAKKNGVGILTLYAFSTENWKRPKPEVAALMKLLETYLDKETEKLRKDGIRLSVIGDINGLPESVQKRLAKAIYATRDNDAFILNLALNYGSRNEILEAVKMIARDVASGKLNAGALDEKIFSNYLYTKDLPDPDLLIRTSGEMRISNFLLWQLSYTEIYVTKTLWPDFTEEDFERAIISYQERERRFGGR